ncbi:MAG TPA: hypothetical protein VGI50_16470, partial [Solirubrobacteraceae bacterium]
MHEEAILERAAGTVDVAKVVDRRALRLDPCGQCVLDRVAQALPLGTRQPPGGSKWMDPGPEQRL